MGRCLLTVTVCFLVPVSAVTALKCYSCSGTEDDCAKSTLEGDKDKYLTTCFAGADKCMRSFLKKDSVTLVRNTCSNQASCKSAITDCGEYDGATCKVSCCDEDECNVGSHVSFNVILLTVCSALGLALMM